jgi:hypothetical protein
MLALSTVFVGAAVAPVRPASAAPACGTVLIDGSSWLGGSGVNVYSNGANTGTGSSCAGTGTYGYQYQCVELINRLFLSKGWISSRWYAPSGGAESMYGSAPSNLAKQPQGSITYLAPGDAVVFNKSFFDPYGHVAAVGVANGATGQLYSQNTGTATWNYSLVGGTLTVPGIASAGNITGVVHRPGGEPPQPPTAAATNLLSNASLERGVFEPWQPMANTDYIAAQDSLAKEGAWYGLAKARVAGASVYQDMGNDPQPGQSYSFSVWLRAKNPGQTVTGNIRLYALGGTVENQGTEYTVGNDWTLVTAPLDVGLSGHTDLRAQIYLHTTGQDLAFDGGQVVNNLLSNASLERGVFEPWQPMANTDYIAAQDSLAKEGAWYGLAKARVAGASVYQDMGNDPQPGQSYSFSVWLRAKNPGQTVTGNIRLYALGGTVENQGTEYTVGNDWTLVTAPLDVGLSGHTDLRAQIYLHTTGQDLAFDGGTLAAGAARTSQAASPTAPTVGSATAGNAQASLNWAAPASNGGSSVTGYVVTPYVEGVAQTPKTYGSTATTQTITGLTNGVTYTFKVAAKNVVGTGPQSAASNAVRPSGTWYLRNSNSAGSSIGGFNYGSPGDLAVTGDWDGNDTTTIGVYRPATSTWFLRNSNSYGSSTGSFGFGSPGDIPVVGDWDGNGTTTIGVYRPSTGTWYLRNANSAGTSTGGIKYGDSTYTPVAGDWDGNGTSTIGLFKTSTATWYLRNTNTAATPTGGFSFGSAGDKPVVGNWDGAGGDTIGVFRPSTATWYQRNTNSGGTSTGGFKFGNIGDQPVTGNWDGTAGDTIGVVR